MFFLKTLLAISLVASAKNAVDKTQLEKALKFYQNISSLKVTFKQVKTLQGLNLKLYSDGNLSVKRPDYVAWEITKPSPLKLTLDKKAVEIVSGSGEDKNVQTFSLTEGTGERAAQALAHLAAWLKLDAQALSDQYEIFELEKKIFEFVPKEKESSPFKAITMKLGPAGHLSHLTLAEISGDTIEIDFARPTIERANAKK